MTEPTYIEGPKDQPWTVNDSGCTIYVERRGCDDRMRGVFTPPYEPAFICDQPEQAQALCDRLNELDRALALIDAIEDHVDGPEWIHGSDSDDNGSWIATCEGRSILRTLIADYREGPESQVTP